MGAVYRLGLEQQIVEWQGKQGLNLGEGPVVTKGVTAQTIILDEDAASELELV